MEIDASRYRENEKGEEEGGKEKMQEVEGEEEEYDDQVCEMLPEWMWPLMNSRTYDSDEEGSRPIRPRWPKTSQLGRDHFTIDKQACLDCGKQLQYAMPMNKRPNGTFLFCHNEESGVETCGHTNYIRCYTCGNFNTVSTGGIVHRPGNSAFDGPSDIFQFMCHHCHREQQEREPGLEECRKQMKAIRELRREDELNTRLQGVQTAATTTTTTTSTFTPSVNVQNFPGGGGGTNNSSKKRKLG